MKKLLFLLLTLFFVNHEVKSQAPSNNTCINAQEVLLPSPGESICVNGTTTGASATFGNSFWICSGNGQDVWYRFTTGFDVEFSFNFIRGTIGNGLEIDFFSQCPPGGYLGFVGCYTSNFSFTMTLQPNTTYYMLVYNGKSGNNSGQGTFQFCIENNVILLPVTLTSFTSECDKGIPLLKWITSSEQNSDYFQIERSRDGENWLPVSKVQAMGNSNTNKDYQFYDMTSGKSFDGYYRLKQVDIDGNFEYFGPVSSFCSDYKDEFISEVFPNPTSGEIFIGIRNNIQENVNMLLTDFSGRVLKDINFEVSNGYTLKTIDLLGYSSGSYLITIITDNNKYVHKITLK